MFVSFRCERPAQKKTESAKTQLEHLTSEEHKLGIVMGEVTYTTKPGISFVILFYIFFIS